MGEKKTKEDIVKSLTLLEKATLLTGHKTMSTFSIPEKGVEAIVMSDGPNGVRREEEDADSLHNISHSLPATCFPTLSSLASSWNKDLAYRMGASIGRECRGFGVNLLLGPAVNIQRNPLCGRNFEYLSEDPLLSGAMGARLVEGIQDQGVGACVKHFACNGNEKYRFVGDSLVDQRALHEIYLKPFEIIVKEAKPRAIMSAYNKVNGSFCSENEMLLEDELRSSWGFDGIVLTDWGGIVHRDLALKRGCDLEMPGMNDFNVKSLVDAVKEGKIKEETLDRSVTRLLDLAERTRIEDRVPPRFEDHYKTALEIALESAVLLKNENGALPLKKTDKCLVIGGLFKQMRYQGSGSSLINPGIIFTHEEAFRGESIQYEFALGYDESETSPDPGKEEEALRKARMHENILFFGGLIDYVESEGFDRESMSLPKNQLSILEKLCKLGKKVVVVLFGGAPMELPFFEGVDAILDMMIAGEACAEASAKLLFGDACPSGKLAQTWPISYEDVPNGSEFTSTPYELYKESIFVGYRYYQSRDVAVRFPFGYGLSYAAFEYRNFSIEKKNNGVLVVFSIKNVGKMAGKEIAEVYLSKKDSSLVRPLLELKGFDKVDLDVGEEKKVEIYIAEDSLSVFAQGGFRVEEGEYELFVGSCINDIRLKGSFLISGEKLSPSEYDLIYGEFLKGREIDKRTFEAVLGTSIPEYRFGKRPYTMETPIGEFDTFFGRIFKKAVCGAGAKKYKKAKRIKDPLLREREKKAGLFIAKLMPSNSLRSLSFSSSGAFPYPVAEGILKMVNGHYASGIKAMMKKYKIEE